MTTLYHISLFFASFNIFTNISEANMTFNLDKMSIQYKGLKPRIFYYEGEKYFYKCPRNLYHVYNELVAHKIAERFGIPSVPYYVTTYGDETGVSSLMFDDSDYVPMSDILFDVYGSDNNSFNNLTDIWAAFEEKYGYEATKKLMDELVNIFLFDVVIGNADRHNENYGIINNDDGPHFAPLFDNEWMLFKRSINYGFYNLGVESNDDCNKLYIFLKNSDSSYLFRLKEMVNKIDDQALQEILDEIVSEGNELPSGYEDYLFQEFNDNREMIKMTIENLGYSGAKK